MTSAKNFSNQMDRMTYYVATGQPLSSVTNELMSKVAMIAGLCMSSATWTSIHQDLPRLGRILSAQSARSR
jgi:hypothetical protein